MLYRAHAKQIDLPPVLLLVPASIRPSVETLKKIDHEYSLRSELDSAWAVRPLDLSEQGMALVLEDPGGETLDELHSGAMEMAQFLSFAVGLATALGGLHERKLIHKDVKPTNVLVDSATGQVRLMGFGIASRLRREHQAPEPPEFIAGTLPYMAPEQTGRMNRSIDSRSDLYALGVTLYEMLTGSLPFTASEPIEWVHCHIARHPVPPHERVKSVPACVSAIVMKLLAKTPEERYQTASGVESDLRRCLVEWEAHRGIADFAPGQHDAPDHLLIPEKLYGRAGEIETLLAAFDRVVAGGRPELVLVSGYSGIGKSAVVNELHKPLVPPRGLFASGKFDQYKGDIPYATLAQAFQSLIRPLLSKSEEELSHWRNALHDALDPNGQLMVGLVPELKAVLGEQPPVPELPQQDAQRRFHHAFRRFISVFARPEHPLALFLDDLQWLDAATLDLVEDLLTQPDVKHLLLIGAYRDNEVDPTHPLTRKLQAMGQAGALLQDIVLAPLTREGLEQLIADSLHCEPGHAGPLAELVHDKTTGNPFFAIQFISALFEEGLLTFDHVQGRWSWDLNRIHAKGYTDNVVDLMVGKLSRLVPATQNALKQLACLGNSAEFTMLGVVHQDAMERLHAQLTEAVGAGFILRSKDSYHFLHDRVQEAAYSLIPQELRAETHLRIGRLMASHTPPDKLREGIFEIVNQLNRGLRLITSITERERIAELNLIAGRRAKTSTAYASALTYLHAGRGLLTDETWNHNYDLIFSIEYLLAECELLTTDMAAAEKRLFMLAERAKSAHDIALVTRLRLTLYTALDRSDRAVEVFLEYWRGRGTDWSPHPTEEEVRREYDHIWYLLGHRQIEELVDLPLNTNTDVLDVLDVFTGVVSPAMFTDARFFALVICRMVRLSLEHGNSDASCYAYVLLGALAGSHFGDYRAGYRIGKLGYDLVEQRGLRRYQARTYLAIGTRVMPWTRHVKSGRELQRRCFDVANRTGDLTFAVYSCFCLYANLLAAGDPLDDVQGEAETGLEFATKIRFGLVIDIITTQLGLIRTLRGLTATFGAFDDERFDEVRFERHLASDRVLALPKCWYWIRKLQARFFAGDYSSAIEASLNAERLLWASPSFFETAEYHFYSALSRAAACDSATNGDRQRHFVALAAHQKQHEIWAQHCPENFEHRAALIGAEMARIEGRILEAEQLYEQAIRSAHDNGFVHNEAIAYELAARFYAARGFQKFADAYLVEARYCYQRWGADGKVAQLDHLYPHLKKEWSISTPASTILAPTELLDLATVIKVSQAVSGEIVLEKVVDSIMRAAIEHAGAERGLLIVPRCDELQIEAEATTTEGDVTVQLPDGPDAAAAVPESLVRYAMRTQESVILEDASSESPFSADRYLVQRRPRSVLALPLINQGKLISILYLENNLTPNVFTPARITVLKVLASQAAISLENTRLYRELEDRERRIRRLVDANILGICLWNLEGAILGANEAFLRMLQYGRDDVASGRLRWTDLTPPEWREYDESARAELNATGLVQAYEKEFLRKDGSRVPVLVAGALFEEGGGEGVGFAFDLSEQKRAEEALRRSESYLAQSQQLAHIGSWAWEIPRLNGLFASEEWYRIHGFDPKDGMPTREQRLHGVHPGDRPRYEAAIDRAIANKSEYDVEYRVLSTSSKERHIHSVGHPILSSRGDVLQFVGVAMDVTETKQAEGERERLRRVRADLAHVTRVSTMGELTASLAHEIKQPIGAAVTNAEACLRLIDRPEPDLPEAREAALEMIHDSRRAAEIIDRVRSLYQKGSSQLETFDLNQMIEEMVMMMGDEANRHAVTIRTDLAQGLPNVMADRVQLQQALMNLMRNGIEAMESTGGELRITSEPTLEDQLLISVRDAGGGLPIENLDDIFNAFFTTKARGTGLGLAITRSVIQSHGGRIWAMANSEGGATFHFALPIKEAATA
ncbi:MAG TPA: AAA family ATPase [Vicinamibacteria bacterium]|nr:AAA family ATPase [Vicinamibacteria bacterium]